MLIRQAAEADLPDVIELLKDMDGEDGIDYGKDLTTWRKISQYPYYKLFVIEENNQIAGTCGLVIIDNLGHKGAKLAVAEGMIINRQFRGRGLGSKLMQFLMAKAKEEDCYKLMLSSNKKRIKAHQFYEKLGFEQHGISFMIEV